MIVDPATTAADVRNALQVMDHTGWIKDTWVSTTGRVCLDGALRLATSHKVVTRCTSILPELFRDQPLLLEEHLLAERYLAAQLAVAEHLPPCSCAEIEDRTITPDPVHFITHYNDVHCTGGLDAEDILRVTAEKLEAEL